MNYITLYIKLIRAAQSRKINYGYNERHHIFPTSIYGDNKYIVCLSAREHYIAHKLLYYGFKSRYGQTHKKTIKMQHAFFMMANRTKLIKTSKEYSYLKELHASVMSNNMKGCRNPMYGTSRIGYENPMYGKNHTQNSKLKMSQSKKNLYKSKENHPRYGKSVSDDTRLKISNKNKGKSAWNLGINTSNEVKRKQCISARNRTEHKPKRLINVFNGNSLVFTGGVKDVINFIGCTTYMFYKSIDNGQEINHYNISEKIQ